MLSILAAIVLVLVILYLGWPIIALALAGLIWLVVGILWVLAWPFITLYDLISRK